MKNESVVGVITTLKNNRVFGFIMSNLIYIIIAIVIITFVTYGILRNSLYKKKAKKEDRLYYLDAMTNLKNRNYLNDNINNWDNTKIYPRTIVMIDLNNLKYVNDNYGHEEGDQLIIKAAAILVNTQLENSEIVRTDGNEFLIYLVGYSERQVDTYTKKLGKEMKSLPHEFGAAVGYSMIIDEIKTIDDAINEATLEMIANKQDLK